MFNSPDALSAGHRKTARLVAHTALGLAALSLALAAPAAPRSAQRAAAASQPAATAAAAVPSVPADIGLGRPATAAEVKAWDIDVRPDFLGLPPGSGSVAKGAEVFEARCASCHGVFGESNEIFSPLIGGTTKADTQTGHAARLMDASFPGRTTFMKLATLSTLWDYIYRAMPWNQPKSLTPDEVYAVSAYLLNLADVVPENFTLSDKNVREVQARMPNRNGMTLDHAMWPGEPLPGQKAGRKPDVAATACVSNCLPAAPQVASRLPDHARNAHGNLAEQNRVFGAQRGADTTRPAGAPAASAPAAPKAAAVPGGPGAALAQKANCMACHASERKVIGPSFREVAAKHGARSDAEAYLIGKITAGGQGVWGAIPMPPQTVSAEDARTLARWVLDHAPR